VPRSGSTIVAALMRSVPAGQAARLSFLMSLIAVGGAAVMKLPDAVDSGFEGVAPMHVAMGAVLAGVVGWMALRTLLLVLKRGALRWFALYCAAIGTVALAVG
jgi:undecaprenyl-diphosphatase